MSRPDDDAGMSLIVRTACGWLKGFILVYGVYLILYGHLTPGGGFSGGVVCASAFVLITLAEGEGAGSRVFSRAAASRGDGVGALLFLLMAVLGLLVAGTFFVNIWSTDPSQHFRLFSGGIMPFCNVGIGLKVCSSLFLVFVVLTALKPAEEPAEESATDPVGMEDET